MEDTLYQTAHLMVAAIRLHRFVEKTAPSVEEIAERLGFSDEQAYHLSRELERLGIIEQVKGSYRTRLFIKDHLAIEKIPRDNKKTRLDDALKSFVESRNVMEQKVAEIKENQAKKRQDLFARIEKQLKKNG